jgi:thioredoxin-like negative regulator of GroEL
MVRLALLGFLVGVVGIACKDKASGKPSGDRQVQPLGVPDPCKEGHREGQLGWLQDDFGKAVACAQQSGRPIVVDIWAPWCHTCLSMQTTVFTDPSFAKDKDRFVFVALDGDKETNADALASLSISAWPTFYVLAADKSVLARYVGGASVAQFHEFLEAGLRARSGGAAGADARLLGAERALAIKDYIAAEQELTGALAAAPADWKRRPDVLVSLIMTKLRRKDLAGCLDVAEQNLDKTGNTAAVTDFMVTALTCADQREKDEPDRVKKLRERAVARWQTLLADPAAELSVDDRSDAMASEREVLDTLGKKDDAKRLAEQQLALLNEAASKAPTPLAAMTYNWQRAEVSVYLGRPLEIVPALEKSAKDLPDEYDPRARLGWVYWKAGKLDEAAKWTDEALKLVYGPRRGRILTQRADIAAAAGDVAAERALREEAVKLWEGLPPSQQSPDSLAKARAALTAISVPKPAP